MYLIDESYFIQELTIPKNDSLDVITNENPLNLFIDRYARLLLTNALGITLFAEFETNLTNGELKQDSSEKWKDLVNGKTYTESGVTKVWKGLLFIEGAFKGSVLAYYVYYHWYLRQMTQMSGFGEVKGGSVNASSINETDTLVRIWNKFIEMYQGSNTVYGTYSEINGVPFYDYYANNNTQNVSLLQFLSDNQENYPDALLRAEEGFINNFGL